ncbi:hypothetical protein NIES2119_03570 [[Phormidium ambiguum] IAM M-71]|uniref:Uncharacterized protein n=1 Tax=[Phormidium ambiguum] IAM M-71 TaxID=454136 RepID=A0A1U7IRQ2_9CYAN|nr:hypothetical protein [Phormidium ambiguum]OKH40039.1 hypothetical protein NIES2119_03570 [Phormidium ambiguum IAM M-71]
MEDSTFAIFLGFGILWAIMGAAAWIALLKSEGEEIRFGKWGLLVIIPIVIPFIAALVIAAVSRH